MHILNQSNLPKIQERGAPCHPVTYHIKILLTASKSIYALSDLHQDIVLTSVAVCTIEDLCNSLKGSQT